MFFYGYAFLIWNTLCENCSPRLVLGLDQTKSTVFLEFTVPGKSHSHHILKIEIEAAYVSEISCKIEISDSFAILLIIGAFQVMSPELK